MGVARTASRAQKSQRKLSPAELAEALKREPLITVMKAADILGIPAPNFKRFKDQLTAVPVEGGGRDVSAYFRSEVEALAGELAERRASRNGSEH